MASHWSEDETLDLLNICIKNYAKFVHLRNNSDTDNFYEDKFFSRFHNSGRNAKNIKNRVETIQKKFRKITKNLNLVNYKSGEIKEEVYTSLGSKDLFNTCFEYERLFGKFNGTRDLIKIMEVVSQSDHWKSVRMQMQVVRNSYFQKSLKANSKEASQPGDLITISSAESSPNQTRINESDDLTGFKDVESSDYSVNKRETRRSDSSVISRFPIRSYSDTGKRKHNDSWSSVCAPKVRLIPNSRSISEEVINISNDFDSIDVEVQTDQKEFISTSFQVELNTHDKETSTNYIKPHLSFSKINFTTIDPLNLELEKHDSIDLPDVTSAINKVSSEQVKTNNIMMDIASTLRDLVNQKVVFLSCSTPGNK